MLVGRASEQRAIATLLAGARVGDSGVLVISGEPGIGKTALLAMAEEYVAEMRVLRAQGLDSEQYVPFAGLLQLLRPVLGLLEQVPAPQAEALSSALLLGSSSGTAPSRFAVGAATLSLLCRAAEDRPIAILVDDAHLLDRSSAEALVFAARRVESDALAILVTVRAGEQGSTLWASLPTLTVSGLDLAAAGELLNRTHGPVRTGRLERLHQATAGNPLALLELGERMDLVDVVPPDYPLAVSEQVSRSFLGRVEGLPSAARTALLVAAADSSSAALVYRACAALGVPDARLADAQDAGLVTLDGDRVAFRHPLVRSAVYGASDPATRRAVHRALAAAVPGEETDRMAWHLAEAAVAPDEATAATLEAVAGAATLRGAHALAARTYERAADLAADVGLRSRRLAAAGEAAWLAGMTDQAVGLLDRARGSALDAPLAAHVAELRGAIETRCGSLDSALSMLLEAAYAAEATEPDAAIRLFADAVHVAFYLGEPSAAMRASDAIDVLLRASADPYARCLGSMASGMAMVLSGAGAEGIERVRGAAFQLVVSDASPADRFRLPLRVQGALWLRDSGPLRDAVSEAVARLREQAALGSLPYLLMHIARDAATTDRWDDAEAAYLESIRLAQETGQTTDLAVSLAGLACLDARRGRVERCRDNVAAADELCRRHRIRLGSFWLLFAQGDLELGAGATDDAVRHYEALQSALAATGVADPDQSCGAELAEALLHLGRREAALAVSTEFAARAAAKAQPWSLARAERATALCEPGPDAETHFRAALDLHAQTPDLFEAARTRLAYGSWLRRRRRRVEARTHLRSSLAAFELLGAAPWADRAVGELRATGETAQRRHSDSADQLTPQERQIARLLAQGRTTREAAAALFLSPKTVEYHLRHVYLKLGIRSRAELTERFRD